MENSAIPQVYLRGFNDPFSQVGMIGFENPQQKGFLVETYISLNSCSTHFQDLAQFSHVEQVPVVMSHHSPEMASGGVVGRESETRIIGAGCLNGKIVFLFHEKFNNWYIIPDAVSGVRRKPGSKGDHFAKRYLADR